MLDREPAGQIISLGTRFFSGGDPREALPDKDTVLILLPVPQVLQALEVML